LFWGNPRALGWRRERYRRLRFPHRQSIGIRAQFVRHQYLAIPGPNASDKNSAPTPFIASTKLDNWPQFSPDGKKIAFTSTRSGDNALWLCDRDGLNAVQLTSSDIRALVPRWSPDSSWIAFNSSKAGNYDIYVISADGGPVRRLTTGPANSGLPGWSRDGRWIYFGSDRSGTWQIWKEPAQGGTGVQVTKKGGAEAFESFNGDFVYYAKYDSNGIWKVPVGGGSEIQILDQGKPGSWALTDKGIYFAVINDAVEPTGVVSLSHEADAIKFYSFATSRLGIVREFSKDTKIGHEAHDMCALRSPIPSSETLGGADPARFALGPTLVDRQYVQITPESHYSFVSDESHGSTRLERTLAYNRRHIRLEVT
jgi:dipeptidyl aminopeptidase/acylaminoacyl peptidase